MKFCVLIVLFMAATQAVMGQCEKCQAIPGEIVDFCFSDAKAPGLCASFTEDADYFFLEDKTDLKEAVIKLPLPPNRQGLDINYLSTLVPTKKHPLDIKEVLFAEQAIKTWFDIDGINKWTPEAVNSGFTLHPSGMAYKALVMGNGPLPAAGKTMIVHYTGYFSDGKKFDSSLDRKQAYRFVLGKGQVVSGWDEGIALMPVGSRFFFRLPPEMAYGSKGFGDAIPPYATLYFDVQLLAAE